MAKFRRGAVVCCIVLWFPVLALAGTQDWQLSEVYRGPGQARFVELVNEPGGCLFPTSRLEIFDAQGNVLQLHALVASTTCYGAPVYFVLASSAAEQTFGLTADRDLSGDLPISGQACFASSGTRYDCVRWGSIASSDAVVDLLGASDTSAAADLAGGASLARTMTTHVVEDDWVVQSPTPRAPNDGSAWEPPDAGASPDASVSPDARAGGPDAAPRADAHPPPDARVDARSRRYLDLDTVGGASCGCGNGAGGVAGCLLLGLAWLLRAFRKRAT